MDISQYDYLITNRWTLGIPSLKIKIKLLYTIKYMYLRQFMLFFSCRQYLVLGFLSHMVTLYVYLMLKQTVSCIINPWYGQLSLILAIQMIVQCYSSL